MGEMTERVEDAIRGWTEKGELRAGKRLLFERNVTDDPSAGRTEIRLVMVKPENIHSPLMTGGMSCGRATSG